jgi:hypothetical protein
MGKEREIKIMNSIRRIFGKEKLVTKDQLGVYHDVWAMSTSNENTHTIRYDIFVKVKAVEVYDNLIEIEVEDVKISEDVNEHLLNIITSSIPKYIEPRKVKWTI